MKDDILNFLRDVSKFPHALDDCSNRIRFVQIAGSFNIVYTIGVGEGFQIHFWQKCIGI